MSGPRDDVRQLLPLYALGALDDADARTVEAAIEADPALAAELDGFLELAPAVAPSAEVKARLLASAGAGRFDAVAPRLAALFDVGIERARELLGLIERSASWETPIPGVHLVHFQGGPAYVAADCGFVRIDPGCTFPWHTHRGEEVSVILEGSMTDRDGNVLRVGEELVHGQGTAHDLVAGADGVLYVARAMNGIEVSGQPR